MEILQLDVLLKLVLALLLGGAVGLERELSGKPAGLRTNMLICVGAALFTIMSLVVAQFVPHDLIRSDPARIAAQIVSGVGFLGAGTILVARGHVVGLTTAATIWTVAAIGIAVGAGEYVIAVGSTVLVVLTLFGLAKLERRYLPSTMETVLQVTLSAPDAGPEAVERILEEEDVSGRFLGWERRDDASAFRYAIRIRERELTTLLRRLAGRRDVEAAGYTSQPGG